MSTLKGKVISKVAIVDDEADSRTSLGWVLADAELEAAEIAPTDLDSTSRMVIGSADAMICDHHLRVTNYANFDGAELVAATIKTGFLAILCTRYTGADIASIRPYLVHIPVVCRPDELNEPEELWAAFAECMKELTGEVRPQRKAWRTQVVVERVDSADQTVLVSVPGWPIEESIRLRQIDFPDGTQQKFKVGFRCYAQVNIGVENPDRLFFTQWEV
jgi:hypothetical protein